MIVIHTDTEQDTSEFSGCYQGIDADVYINPSRDFIDNLLIEHPTEPVMLIGHGSEKELYGIGSESAIDSSNANLLRNRIVIGIWCYASNFADRNNLNGFFTSMFVSNLSEALAFNVYDNEDCVANIHRENILFSNRISTLIQSHEPLDRWPELLQRQCNRNLSFVRFNYEALYSNSEKSI